jgi:hypothetical protein
MYKNHRRKQYFDATLGVLAVVGLVVAIGSAVYMQYLYVAGEISPQDYARYRGQPPTVVIVNPQ